MIYKTTDKQLISKQSVSDILNLILLLFLLHQFQTKPESKTFVQAIYCTYFLFYFRIKLFWMNQVTQ